MTEEIRSERGIQPGGIWAVVLVVVAVFACVAVLFLTGGIESSRASRAQARAAAEEAQASARAAEARAEVDKVAIRADAEIQLQVDRLAHELAMLRQQQENWEHTYSLALLAVSHLDEEQLSELEAQLSAKEEHTPGWWIAVSVAGAALVFMLIVIVWSLVRAHLFKERTYYE